MNSQIVSEIAQSEVLNQNEDSIDSEEEEKKQQKEQSQKTLSSKLNNYTIHHHIGEGAFGEVSLAVEKETGKNVAIKAVSIMKIIELNKERHILREKELLMDLKHPSIIELFTTFKVSYQQNYLICKYRMTKTCTSFLKSAKMELLMT